MRICIVCPNFPSPTVPDYIEGIFRYKYAKLLTSNGHEVFIVTTKIKGMPSFEQVDGIKIFRIYSYFIPKIRYPIPLLPKLIQTVIHIVRKYKIDIVEFNTYVYPTAFPILFIGRSVKIPVTLSVDGLPGVSYFYDDKVVDFFGFLFTSTLGKAMLRKAAAIRLSHSSLIDHLANMGIPRTRLFVIHNAVDPVFFRPVHNSHKREELGIDKEDTFVLYVGRLDSVKGVGYLISAAKNLIQKHKNLKFVLVGDGAMFSIYRKMAANFEEQIIFTGVRRDIASLMKAADMVVLPSVSEGCPNVVIEAGASGIPVIASNVGAVPEIIANGKTGLVVHPRSVTELEKAIQIMIENPRRAREMGENARRVVSENFDIDAVSSRVNAYYQAVINDKPS